MFFEKKGSLFIGKFVELFNDHELIHGFSTRKGGVSSPPYDSLNLGINTADAGGNVSENRKRFFNSIGFSEKLAAIPEQVHGDNVEVITESGIYPDTDSLITNVPGIVLIIHTADCVPLFLYEPENRVIGLVHAGWRGVYKGIVKKTIEVIIKNFSTNSKNISAFLGPSIGPCCYRIGSNIKQKFSSKYIHNCYLDLWTCLHDQLAEAGCSPENILLSRLCTSCHPEWFFSHRRSKGETGRMAAFFYLKKNT